MFIKKVKVLIAIVVALILVLGLTGPVAANNHEAPGRYIVVLKAGASLDDVARDHGLATGQRYLRALNGFAAEIPAGKLTALKNDPRVRYFEKDQLVYMIEGQVLPTGVDRIDAENLTNKGTGIKVAVIDTGIDKDHPDLNVVDGVNFVGWYRVDPNKWDDDNGHGSWVAGIIAAVDNGIGYVGVAPEASLYGVKVLDRNGSGYMSDVIAGVDWAAQNGIQVANMSLGTEGTSGALHEAIINATGAGVTIVVAAGNSSADADAYVPATYDEVITVSAIADYDGLPGGLAEATTDYGADDTFASFSNYGADVDIAAPGVDIYSTYKNGGYAHGSGTSASSPHVAGVAALYIKAQLDQSQPPTPAQVRQALINAGWAQGSENAFTGDPDSYPEPLVNAAAVVGPPPTLESISITPGTASVPVGLTQQYTATGTYSDGSTKDITTSVTWESSNTSVATIDITGLATAVAEGDTNITAAKDGVSSNVATLTVTAPILVSIAVTPETASIEAGSTQEYVATGAYSDGSTVNITNNVSWASSNTSVATINSTGLATGVGEGETTITATQGEITGSATLTVTAPVTLDSIAVAPSTASITIGGTQQFTATGTYSDGSTADLSTEVAWASSNTSVATIDGAGMATGVSVGTVTITATLDSLTASAELTVTEEPTTAIMSIHSVTVELVSRWRGWNYYAEATVTIVDSAGNPVEGATVSGQWSGATSDQDSGITDANGQVILTSDSVRKPASETTFTFTATSVTHPDFEWDKVEKSGTSPAVQSRWSQRWK